MALGLDDVRVGMWTHPERLTGCTVIIPPEGTLGAIAVRGASPGSRYAVALSPAGKLQEVTAIMLAGGSAFGLAAADGATTWLEEQGVGYKAASARIPIVASMIVLDASVAHPGERPDQAAGYAACGAATTADPEEGSVGAGAGCTIAKTGGIDHGWRGGQGIAVRRAGDLVVGALVANNAVGELRDDDGTWIARARIPDDQPRYPEIDIGAGDAKIGAGPPEDNTVIGCIVTNARLEKIWAHRVADLAHAGIDRAVRPAHTYYDGDGLACLATGAVEATIDLVAALATDAVAEACRRGPMGAVAHHDVPAIRDGG